VPLIESAPAGDLPPLALLDPAQTRGRGFSKQSLEAMSRQVEIKLRDFAVEAEVVAVYPGPVVTLFELRLAPGTKVSKITNLSKDLAPQKPGKVGAAHAVGMLVGKKAQELGLKQVVFDRGGYLYHGRVRAVAEGARETGLEF